MTTFRRITSIATLSAALALGACASPSAPEVTVTSAPETSLPTVNTIAVIGDYGSGDENEQAVADLVAAAHPSAVFTVGDNVYSDGGYAHLVGDFYGDFITNGRFHPATGNHDYSEGIEHYDSYFGTQPGARYGEVTKGDISFFVLDDQAAWDDPAYWQKQQVWLKRALADSQSRYKVVLLHHPPFSSGSEHGYTPETQLDFAGMGADLVIAGHDHISERMQIDGISYLIAGAGGKNLYSCVAGQVTESVFCDDEHFAALFLDATVNELRGRFVTADGSTLDSFRVSPRR